MSKLPGVLQHAKAQREGHNFEVTLVYRNAGSMKRIEFISLLLFATLVVVGVLMIVVVAIGVAALKL